MKIVVACLIAFATGIVVTTPSAANPAQSGKAKPVQIKSTQMMWRGSRINPDQIIVLVSDQHGIIKLPVASDGHISSFWIDPESKGFHLESTSTLKNFLLDSKSRKQFSNVFVSDLQSTGIVESKFFIIPEGAKKLVFYLVGGLEVSQCSVSLDVDGQDNWSQTAADGTGSINLKSWSVDALSGKVARIRIADNSPSQFIGLGEPIENQSTVATAQVPSSTPYPSWFSISKIRVPKGSCEEKSGPTLGSLGLREGLLSSQRVGMTFPFGTNDDLSPVFDVGIAPELHARLVDIVALRTYREVPNLGTDFDETTKRLSKIVTETLEGASINSNEAMRQWLMAEAICAYTTSQIRYAFDQVKPGFSDKSRFDLQDPLVFMKSERPVAVCDGFCRLGRVLATRAGLKCYHIDGNTRASYTGFPSTIASTTHGWLLFEFPGGIRVPADVTNTWPHRLSHRDAKKKVGWRILPRSIRAWQATLAFYYQTGVVTREPKIPNNISLTAFSLSEWAAYNASSEGKLNRWYDDQDSFTIGDYTP